MPAFRRPQALPQPAFQVQAAQLMRKAIAVARTTPTGDIPVGAIVLNPAGEIIGAGTNRREADNDPTAHAEIMAIREAACNHNDGWRLTDCTLVVTLEPCTMCAGAIVGSRLKRLVFGAFEPKTGACGSVFDVVRDRQVLHSPEVLGGVLADECAALLADFFTDLR